MYGSANVSVANENLAHPVHTASRPHNPIADSGLENGALCVVNGIGNEVGPTDCHSQLVLGCVTSKLPSGENDCGIHDAHPLSLTDPVT